MPPKKQPNKQNKHLVLVISIILTVMVLSAGYLAERFLVEDFYPVSIVAPFVVLAAGFILKKKFMWFPIQFGIGMLIYIIGTW